MRNGAQIGTEFDIDSPNATHLTDSNGALLDSNGDATFLEAGRFGFRANANLGNSHLSDFVVSADDASIQPCQAANVVILEDVTFTSIGIENVLPFANPMNTGIFAIQIVEAVDPGPELTLTDVSLTGPTSLRVSWSGGDGTNTVERSTDGQNRSDAATGVGSPATITVDTAADERLFVRVIEP